MGFAAEVSGVDSDPLLRYLGLSSFEVQTDERNLVVDPWIEDLEWSSWNVADFDDADYVLVTHGARDHLGDALPIARESGATLVTEPAVAEHAKKEGLCEEQITTVIWGNRLSLDSAIEVRAVECRHVSYFRSGEEILSGMPLGFHIELGQTSLYYVGDTSLFTDLELFVSHHDPDIVLLPVGSAPGDLAPMPPEDAAVVTSWLEVDTILPVHYVPGSDEPHKYRTALDRKTDGDIPHVLDLDVGEELTLPP